MQPALPLMLLTGAVLLVVGCPSENYDSLVPTTVADIDLIRNDANLAPQEKRTLLAELGVSPSTINGLLLTERLGNQYGGDLRTAYTKVIAPDFLDLTPDEIQVYGDEASVANREGTLNVNLTDGEAQAIVMFFEANNISSPTELEAFLNDTANSVPGDIPDGVLRELFIDFDPSLLLPRLP